MRELSQIVRSLFARRNFTFIILITLALGIGANGAMWSLAHAVFLQALPYPEGHRLVAVDLLQGEQQAPFSYLNYVDFAESLRPSVFQELAVFGQKPFIVKVDGEPLHVEVELVSASYFDLLGHEPQWGRRFSTEEDTLPRGRSVVILSDGFWRRHFAGKGWSVGEALQIGDEAFEVIGVMAPGFYGLHESAEMWVPATAATTLLGADFVESRRTAWFEVVGRLHAEETVASARAAADAVMKRLAEQFPEANRGRVARLRTLREAWFGNLHAKVQGLGVSALLVLLLALVNSSCLLWARTVERRRELALRSAMGATRWQLVRRLLLESLVLALCSSLLALVLMHWVLRWLSAQSALDLRAFVAVEVGPTVVAGVFVLGLFTGLLCSVVPALGGTRLQLARELAEGGGGMPPWRRRLDFLAVVEVALAFVLLYGAFFAAERFKRFAETDLGYRTDRLVTLRTNLSGALYASQKARIEVGNRLLNELRATPEVEAVALVGPYLPGEAIWQTWRMTIEDWGGEPELASLYVEAHRVSLGYFEMMEVDVLEGRGFHLLDSFSGDFVAIVSAETAERCWPGRSAVGRRLQIGAAGAGGPAMTVVGVVEDLAESGFGERSGRPHLYAYMGQIPPSFPPTLNILLRTERDVDEALVDRLHEVVQAVVPDLPTYDVQTLEQRLDTQLAGDRFLVRLMVLFTLLALALTAAGIYGLASYRLASRKRALGVRLALGALPGGLFRRMLGQGLRVALVGCGVGACLTLFAIRGLESRLDESFSAPFLLASVLAILMGLNLLVLLWPAWRASRLDPMTVLREE